MIRYLIFRSAQLELTSLVAFWQASCGLQRGRYLTLELLA